MVQQDGRSLSWHAGLSAGAHIGQEQENVHGGKPQDRAANGVTKVYVVQ
jgi:hypothetical protein